MINLVIRFDGAKVVVFPDTAKPFLLNNLNEAYQLIRM